MRELPVQWESAPESATEDLTGAKGPEYLELTTQGLQTEISPHHQDASSGEGPVGGLRN